MARSASSISVVMATYNGDRYLTEQLGSILRQSRPPDELVLCDDASTDASVSVAAELLSAAGIPHRVLTTPSNLGVAANFARGIEAATGDLIVLADQDDVWYPHKLSTLDTVFQARSSPVAMFTDADLIGPSGLSLRRTLWSRAGLDGRRRKAMLDGRVLSILMHKNFVTGATLAFDAELRSSILPLSARGLHDQWISLTAAAQGRLLPIPSQLIAYRVHDGNTVGLPGGPLRAQLRARSAMGDVRSPEIDFHEEVLGRVRSLDNVLPDAIEILEGKLRHLRFRQTLPHRHVSRALVVGRRLVGGDYGRYARGLRSAAYDVVS